MAISHLKTAPFQGTLFIFFKQETDTARSSFPHYSCKRSVTSLCGGDRMAFSGSIKARERPCTQKKKKGKNCERPKRGKRAEPRGWEEKDRKRLGGNHRTGKKPREKNEKTRGTRKKTGRETEPGENFGPSTSSTSCFYYPCLRLERRRLDREELRKTKAQRQKE